MARRPKAEPDQGSSPTKKWRRSGGARIPNAKDIAAAAQRKQRRARVFELKAATAASFDQIGRELGISGRQAKKDYARAAIEYGQETAAQHKAKANARFDRQLSGLNRVLIKLLPLIERADGPPDLEAVARYTSLTGKAGMITRDQAKMNGAFAPTKVEHTGVDGGPISMTLSDLEKAITIGRENADAGDGDGERVEH